MKNKANIVNTLTIVIAAVILLVGIVTLNPKITGAVVGNEKVSSDLIDKLNSNGEAEVIVTLKDDSGISIKDIAAKRQEVKQKQNAVLSKLDYFDANDKVKAKGKLKDLRLIYSYSTINAFSGNISLQGLQKLQNDPAVDKIVLARKVNAGLTNSVPLINADDVWGIQANGNNITGKGQTICIIDTGIDYTHESLGNCTLANLTARKCKVISGTDFVNHDSDPMDDNNHGTHVAGIAAANGSIFGVAKGANIVAIKALDSGGSGSDADVIAGIDWCTNNATLLNISVISMSLGDGENYTSSNCPTTMDTSMQNAVNNGLTVVVASGNEGKTNGINYPACSPYAISVGASDNSDVIASFSDTSSLLKIVAPGSSITSVKRGGGTLTLSGTSMATPHVAGVAALIYQYEKEVNNRSATRSEVLSLITRSNVSVASGGLSFPRIDALIAVNGVSKLNSTTNSVSGNQVSLTFLSSTNIENVSEAFSFGRNFISLNSSKYPLYNKSTNITFVNLTFAKMPVIIADNSSVCTDCRALSYSSGTLIFNVSHFTNYSAGPNAQILIFDENDTLGGGRSAKVLDQIYFYANYSNRTSNVEINTSICNITFSDSNTNMTFNFTSKLYELNRTFSTSNTFNYNVSCSDTNFETVNSTDSIFVGPKCLDQTPNVDITISSGQKINCTSDSIKLTNQSINIYGELLLNNSILVVESTGSLLSNISVMEYANLTILNSTANGTTNTLTILGRNFSSVLINGSSLIGSVNLDENEHSLIRAYNSTIVGSVALRGNTTNNFTNISFGYSQSSFVTDGDSVTTIMDSKIDTDVRVTKNSSIKIFRSNLSRNISFSDQSYSEFSNSSIKEILQLGSVSTLSSIVNFTQLNSKVDNITQFKLNSTIYGYVDFPSTAGYFAVINVHRFYPVQVNFTTGAPASNHLVNVTNLSNGIEFFSGYTDSNGFLNIQLNFTQSNRFDNFSVEVNPQLNITLLSDTPLIFNISDTTPPIISNVINWSITNQSAKINWTTDESSNTSVNYGTSLSLGTFSSTDDSVLIHSRTLSSLINFTIYFYNVTSCSSGGCNTSGPYNFTTIQNTAVQDSGNNNGNGGGGGGGGSTTTPACESSWYCDLWSKCVDGSQSRICDDINGCVPTKTETQSCIVKDTSGLVPAETVVEKPKEETKTTTAVIEVPKAAIWEQTYIVVIWFIVGLFLALILARRVDTFPLILKEEEKYIKNKDVERSEKLLDKVVVKFSKSKERERKYVERIQKLAKDVEILEKESEKNTSYDEFSRKYEQNLKKYFDMLPDQRKKFEEELEDSRKKALEAANRQKDKETLLNKKDGGNSGRGV